MFKKNHLVMFSSSSLALELIMALGIDCKFYSSDFLLLMPQEGSFHFLFLFISGNKLGATRVKKLP